MKKTPDPDPGDENDPSDPGDESDLSDPRDNHDDVNQTWLAFEGEMLCCVYRMFKEGEIKCTVE